MTTNRYFRIKETLVTARRKRAEGKIKKAADFLYNQGATKVYVFGSFLEQTFYLASDIDLAVEGLLFDEVKKCWLESRLIDIFGDDFDFDLVYLDEEGNPPDLCEKVRKEGLLCPFP
jgi:predicted nucleotidyltransferase